MAQYVWTKHALERNKERQITQTWIEQTINESDSSNPIEDGKKESRKRFGNKTVSVITKSIEDGKTLILSAWIDPPNYGTRDYKNKELDKRMKNASTLRKFLLTFLNQIDF